MELSTERAEVFSTHLFGQSHQEKGLLLIHDGWGVLEYNVAWAERFAQANYRVILVDLYDGQHPSDMRAVNLLTRELTAQQETVQKKLAHHLMALKKEVNKVAVLGWAFGGVQAQRLALNYPTLIDALAVFYCRLLITKQRVQELQAPMLAVFAENESTWPDKQADLEQIMYEADKTLVSHSYPADAGFINSSSETYDNQACERAWHDTRAFLDRYLSR
jgi:carboxymethylenebutenolidase